MGEFVCLCVCLYVYAFLQFVTHRSQRVSGMTPSALSMCVCMYMDGIYACVFINVVYICDVCMCVCVRGVCVCLSTGW